MRSLAPSAKSTSGDVKSAVNSPSEPKREESAKESRYSGPSPRHGFQTGPPDDPLEREADFIASEAMRVSPRSPRPATLRTFRGNVGDQPAISIPGDLAPETFHGKGAPVPSLPRRFFEHRLHHDFSSVRLHHGPAAQQSARFFGARAYTYGSNIVFGSGEYSPDSSRGQRLLAH